MRKQLLNIMMLAGGTAALQASPVIPWTEEFNSESAVSEFTIIDANHDNKTWGFNNGGFMRMYYHSDHAMNDWLITPGFEMTAGRTYKFTLAARTFTSSEKFEVFVGNSASAEAMTIPVISETTFTSKGEFQDYSGEFTIPSTGTWYIGIHGCSDADRLYLDVDNLRLTQGVNTGSPAAVTNLTAAPSTSGANEVEISFTLPTTTVEGDALSSVSKIEVMLDGSLLWTLPGAETGSSVSRRHEDAPAGTHTYTVAAYNGDERGEEASVSCFIGQKAPAEVTGLKAIETNPGEVRISWDVPKDIDGNPLNPEFVRYKVVQNVPFQESYFIEEDIEGADNIAATEFIHHPVAEGEQQIFTSYGVYAITSGGKSRAVKLPLFPVGTPYATPYTESFANAERGSLTRSETIHFSKIAATWDVYSDKAMENVKPQDNDGGMMVMTGYYTRDCARLYFGKVDLSNVASPALTFYLYNEQDVENNNTLEVYAAGLDNHFRFVKEFIPSQLSTKGWNMVIVPLEGFDGPTQFVLQGTVVDYDYIVVDNFRVGSIADKDLCAGPLTTGGSVIAGKDYVLNARVSNVGTGDVSGYDVILLQDNKEVDRVSGQPLQSGQTAIIPFNRHCDIISHDETTYLCRIEYSGDENNGNNDSPSLVISPIEPTFPAPSALSASADLNTVTLRWTAANPADMIPQAETDSFEDYTPYSGEFGGWVTIDADGNQNGKFADITFPGINDNVAGGQSSSFWILDSSASALNSTFASHSGKQCMVQIFNYANLPCDDWAISPMIYEGETEISFFAKSYSAGFSEKMELLWSDGSTDTADFQLLESFDVPNSWTQYSYTLPEAARRFALRCTSTGGYMLMIDDVTYTPAEASTTLELVGYNIYDNGDRINTEPVSGNEYVCTAQNGDHTYHVTALYNAGESIPAEPVTIQVKGSGISQTSTGAVVRAGRGNITISGLTGRVTVYTADGKRVADTTADGSETVISLDSGIYIIRYGDSTAKIIVR